MGGNATLGGNGFLSAPVNVLTHGSLEAGNGSGTGNLTLQSLSLGTNAADVVTLNLAANSIGMAAALVVTNLNGFTNKGTTSVNISGSLPISNPASYSLITYSGTLQGSGTFTPGGIPSFQSTAYLSNNIAASAIQLIIPALANPNLTWVGFPTHQWDVSGSNVWRLSGSSTKASYADGKNALFDDSATNFNVNLAVVVQPNSVTVYNNTSNYLITGSGSISNNGSFTKTGVASLTLGTANTYTGSTLVAQGTLVLGSTTAISPGSSSVTVNGTLDVNGYSPLLNNLSGTGLIDNKAAGSSPLLTINNTTSNTFSGTFQNTTGSLAANLLGGGALTLTGINSFSGPLSVSNATLIVNGRIAGAGLAVASSAILGGTGVVTCPVTLQDGSTLVLTANNPLTVGALTLGGKINLNFAGNISLSSPGTYALLNHGVASPSGTFVLPPLTGLSPGLTAQLVDTNNQLQLVIQNYVPTGTIADVKHVVVFMKENRSFDHYFGTLHGVHGFNDRNIMMMSNGNSVLYQPSGSGYELPYHTSTTCITDVSHGWGDSHNAVNNGQNDAWVPNKGTTTMCYYNRSDLPYYYALADAYTVCDEYHCSVLSSTDPNRIMLMSGMIDPTGMGAATIGGTTYPGGPLIDNTEPAAGWGPGWVTYPERLQNAGVTWKVYQQPDNDDDNALAWFAAYKQAAVGSPLYNNGVSFAANFVTEFLGDVSSNTLPQVSWIVAPTSLSEHPPYSPQSGEAVLKQLLDALAANPGLYSNTVFILNFDENGGFYDHSLPILPPAGTTNEFVGGLPIGLGIRVPCIIISPWTQGGHVCSQVFDHTSVIRFLETWTGVHEPNISNWRRAICGDLTSAFDFAHPAYDYPGFPSTTSVDCPSSSSPPVPSPQVVPTQEAGTLTPRPLPYQPNAWAIVNRGTTNITIVMTNTGSAIYHFMVTPNLSGANPPQPFDLAASGSTNAVYSASGTGSNYDLSCYGPDGFGRRFAGTVNSNSLIEAVPYLNPSTGGIELALVNATASPVSFTVVDGYGLSTNFIAVTARNTNVLTSNHPTNYFSYDLTVSSSFDHSFLRRFLGRVETNSATSSLSSSANPSTYGSNVTFTSSWVGYGVPTGTVQFYTNGTAFGSVVPLSNGVATLTTPALSPGSNTITAVYSGDLLNTPATNAIAQFVVAPPVIATGGVGFSGGHFQMKLIGPAGQSYRVLTSSNLSVPMASWQVMGTGVFGSTPTTFNDTNATPQVQRFYRVVSP